MSTVRPLTFRELLSHIREFVEQRKWDHFIDDEEAQAHPSAARDATIRYLCYQEVLDLIDGNLDSAFLGRVYDRSQRRQTAKYPR